MSKTINQQSIDRIASFVEACGELEKEPFFSKDEKLSFRSAGNRWTFTFGDRFHFRSALISFRRVWMQTEPSNWERIVTVLKNPSWPQPIAAFAEHHKKQISATLSRSLHLMKLQMPSERIIDLWLSTVFAHGGLQGRNKRSDFESAVDQYGHAVFEFSFRSLVREIGFEFLNINNLAAKPALDHGKQHLDLSPSFRLGAAFGVKRREKTKEGHIVVREVSSEFSSEETFEERCQRIMGRYEHKEIHFVLKNLDASVSELLRLVLCRTSLTEVLQSLGGRLELKAQKWDSVPKPEEGFKASWAIDKSRVDVFDDCVVITDEPGKEALNTALTRLRKQFLEG